jgi:hypothetical protein
MDFVDLIVFKTVVDEGGVTKAARKLHRVPSSVTTRIQQLETALGVSSTATDSVFISRLPVGCCAATLSGSSSFLMRHALLCRE